MSPEQFKQQIHSLIDEKILDLIRLLATLDKNGNTEFHSEVDILRQEISKYVILQAHVPSYIK